ncbi:DNA-directed RNA polymerase, omega subunit [Ehrlichia chaffeensis str. Heartland]|uniref:DNA-directed RNA polymerase subunit omega n=1 Tax=Ehrlichia chaffeensis (strain ATCC CRL-10679 / Arkansas) TaxID=205920 RepID=RPOZ_EHRCR|nr:DNA-directed RNA polymerase subunit omega [Ehrlichia chaffeensis]Q2GG39.1 RecName: Full=DNA-directed RNA polymerase subunit omega; Short=RNAP omega subunit; AltName: Full=RNA polymerase omega subunit; AltName: Full=Transcriptase subunit omega [Ehrlichia chaffeensis str. Arkansas]ABD45328.1 DNA-directed RNA polymerase, omega subunit [Ehrlichia chaffeensis str. Arkansas]AHX03854.1 DNA-directed RNA polymerase, omega subunit [Ehrlichia chaffeensis str. Heartland]AHX05421.1 DNA-directed RNA polym
MARLTVEECMGRTNNKFKLVILASQRAHDLNSGACPVIKYKNGKNTVIALKEIAAKQLDVSSLFNLSVQRCRKYMEKFINSDEPYIAHKPKNNVDIFQASAVAGNSDGLENSSNSRDDNPLGRDNFFSTPENRNNTNS